MKDEFLEILSKYQGILHKVSLIYFHNATEREDNFQEIVYQLWKSFPSIKNRNSIGSWIYAVSINTSISRLKKKPEVVYCDKLPEGPVVSNQDENSGFKDEVQCLLRAIQRLNEADKTVMLLYLEERSYEEIAEILGISQSNVGVRISRSKIKLKQYLKV